MHFLRQRAGMAYLLYNIFSSVLKICDFTEKRFFRPNLIVDSGFTPIKIPSFTLPSLLQSMLGAEYPQSGSIDLNKLY